EGRGIVWLGVLIATFVGLHVAVRAHDRARSALPVLGVLPAFSLTDQDGKSFDAKNLDVKITVVDFVFTRCGSICPMLTERARDLSRRLDAKKIGPSEVALVSITVDPEGDTPPVLAAYA